MVQGDKRMLQCDKRMAKGDKRMLQHDKRLAQGAKIVQGGAKAAKCAAEAKLDAWFKRYLPVEEEILADIDRRRENKAKRRAERFRRFGDLCEATGGLAKVADVKALRRKFGDDRWFQICLKGYLGTAEWKNLEGLRRKIRRPSYYEAENQRRRLLRAERRKVRARRTLNSCPSREEILEAWLQVRSSHEAMLKFGSLIMDLECYLDNSLIFDEAGNLVGRRGGVKRWLQDNIYALYLRYTTVMRYKAAAKKVRQIVEIADPVPAAAVLGGRDYAADEIALLRARAVWLEVSAAAGKSVTSLLARIDALLDPEAVEDGNMLADWKARYAREITWRTKNRWRKRLVG